MEEASSSEWLFELLHQVQLEQFYVRIRDELQVSRLQHFEYVQPEDLEKIGMSKPAAKRLLDIIKKRRLKSKFIKFLPTVGKAGTIRDKHAKQDIVQKNTFLRFRLFRIHIWASYLT